MVFTMRPRCSPTLWIDELTLMRSNFNRAEGALLVGSHQPAVAGDIGRQNGGEPPLRSVLLQEILHGALRLGVNLELFWQCI